MTDLIAEQTLRPTLQWHRICRVDDLENAWGEAALLGEAQVALFRLSASEVYAVTHRDPWTQAPVMARGIVGSRGSRPTIASPLHKQVYDLATGECFGAPDLHLQTFPVQLVEGFVEVGLAA